MSLCQLPQFDLSSIRGGIAYQYHDDAHFRAWLAQVGLEEHHRQTAPFRSTDAFHASIQCLFQYPSELMFGEETADAAYQRFAHALQQLLDAYPAQTVAVVTHGCTPALIYF